MSAPKRIQRRRTKGWRTPANAVYVGRGSKWGNPFAPGMHQEVRMVSVRIRPTDVTNVDGAMAFRSLELSVESALALYRDALQPIAQLLWLDVQPLDVTVEDARRELAGCDLSCWCPLDQPCHADILLDLANRPPG